MANIYDYFLAPNDDLAAKTIDWDGGPGARVKPRGLFAKRTAGYRTLSAGIEPVVELGMLEQLLTGVTFDAQLKDSLSRPLIAERDNGERLVIGISRSFAAALADAPESMPTALALPWSEIEEFRGMASIEVLSAFLSDLRKLALDARADGYNLYCWLSV